MNESINENTSEISSDTDIESNIEDTSDLEINSKNDSLLKSNLNTYDENDDDDDDDDDDNDEYLKKLENNRDFVIDSHKEIFNINYKVIEKLCNINRDEFNMINDPNHITVPILTKYEKTKILGLRTKQINNGSKPFISINEEIIDGEIIANLELQAKKIPFIIKRPISTNKFEYWKLEDLEII